MDKYWNHLIAIGLLVLVAIGKTLDKYIKKEAVGKLGVVSSLLYSLIGGTLTGILSKVYIETVEIQWLFVATGAWLGERVLEALSSAVESKIDLIFKNKNTDGTEKEE